MEEGEGGGRHLRLGRGDRVQRRTQDAKETYKGFDAKKKKHVGHLRAKKEEEIPVQLFDGAPDPDP